MIINVPIYLEIEGKFSPVEGRELTLGLRKLLRDSLFESTGGKLRVKTDEGRILTVALLSEQQAINRFGARLTKASPNPPQGDNPTKT
jgi:hypothetical protein